MQSKAWLKKNFGDHQYPSLASGILGLVGSTIGNQWSNLWAFGGGFAGAVGGYVLGAVLQPEIIRYSSSKHIAKKKMVQDFANSALKSRLNYELIIDDLNGRYEVLKQKNRTQRTTPVLKDSTEVNIFSASGKTYKRNGKWKPDEAMAKLAKQLTDNINAPISINCSCLSLGVIATLVSLRKHYGVALHIDKSDTFGVEQIRKVASNQKNVDFLIAPEPPFLLASNNLLDDYYRLFAIFSEQQRVVRRQGGPTKWMEVLYLKGTTGEEQVMVGNDIPVPSKPIGIDLIEEMEERIEAMRKGDSAVIWEPIATMWGNKPDYYLEKGIYHNWFVCYCQERWLSPEFSNLKNAFVTLFVNEWRYCEQNINETWKLLYEDDTLFIESYKERTLSA